MTINIINRPATAPAWAQSAGAGDIERPSDAFISAGWVQSAEPPFRQFFNYALGSSAQIAKYLLQNGIPKWVSDESYPVDAVTIHDHKMWRAVRDNIGVVPGTSLDDWASAAGMIDGQGQGGGGVGKIIAGAGISIDPANGTGDVTVSSTVSAPTTGGKIADIGAWRIIVGTGQTVTGYKDVITMPGRMNSVFAISITEHNAEGWGPPGPDGEVTGAITLYGATAHADKDKFYLSGAKQAPGGGWKYSGGLGIQYIAIGENPDYVAPAPVAAP